MEISEDRIGYVCIPRFALAKRVIILWLFELAACITGTGVFLIDTILLLLVLVWVSLKFLPVWRLYYKTASLYIILLLSFVPACLLGRLIREAILWLIML